jgi:hypothetical protein
MPWGKYKGQTLDVIAVTDAGLKYLDWLLGELDKKSGKHQNILQALVEYLGDAAIARDLENLKGN